MGQDSFDELFHADADRFIILPKFVLLDKRLGGQHRDLYCLLKTYSFQKDFCFPSIKRLSLQLRCSTKTIRNNLDVLVECGLIERKKRRNKTNIYTIVRPEKVYVESVDPWKLKDWYLEDLKETIFNPEEEEVSTVVNDDPDEEARVKAALAKKSKDRAAKMIGGLGDIREKGERARANAQRNKNKKKKYGSPVNGEEVDPVHPDEKPLNAKDAEAAWRLTAKEVYGEGSGVDKKWGGMEYGIAKRLMASHGPDYVIRCFDYILRNWEEYQERYRVKGYPNLKSIAYFSEMWFPEIERGEKKDPISNRTKSLRQGEF